MPATAGRVRMPANNRVHSSAALQTHGIWQSAIGYDPYAPEQKEAPKDDDGPTEKGGDNAYDSFQGLLALARLTGSNASEARGSCKKCNRVGHLTFQCRNFLTAKEEIVGSMDPNGDMVVMPEGIAGEGEEDEDESDLSESDLDSEMERALARAVGGYSRPIEVIKDKKAGEKGKGSERSSRKRRRREEEEESSDSESEESSEEERSNRRKQRKSSSRSRRSDKHRSKKSIRKSRAETRDDSADSSRESEDEPRRKKRNDRERRKKNRKVDSDDSVESEERRERRDRRKKKGKERSSSSKKVKDRRKKNVDSGNEESK